MEWSLFVDMSLQASFTSIKKRGYNVMDEFLQEYNKNFHLIYINIFNRYITDIPFDKIMINHGVSDEGYEISVHDTLPSAFNFLGCKAIVLLYEDQNKHIFEREYKLLQLGKYHKHGINHENKIVKLPIGEYSGIHQIK